MPKVSPNYVPKYRRHAATNQARVVIEGKTFYLGPWKSKASYLEYDRVINEWLANGRRLPASEEQQQEITLAEVMASYRKFARKYYRKNGKVTREAGCIDDAIKHIRRLYGKTPAAEFGPRRLKTVIASMIGAGWTRKYINKQIGRVKRMFRWAASEEMIPPSVPQGLGTVPGLRIGRSDARDNAPIPPVPDSVVNATLEHLPQTVADMIRLQRLTGMRPGEVCMLRPMDVDTSGAVWCYRPASHKTEHHGRERVVFIGPQGQDVLRPYLLRPAEVYCLMRQRFRAG